MFDGNQKATNRLHDACACSGVKRSDRHNPVRGSAAVASEHISLSGAGRSGAGIPSHSLSGSTPDASIARFFDNVNIIRWLARCRQLASLAFFASSLTLEQNKNILGTRPFANKGFIFTNDSAKRTTHTEGKKSWQYLHPIRTK